MHNAKPSSIAVQLNALLLHQVECLLADRRIIVQLAAGLILWKQDDALLSILLLNGEFGAEAVDVD